MHQETKHSDKLLKKKYGIIGSSEPMRKAKKILLKAAPTELTILITGDTGTGKEVFAKAVHGLSPRKAHRFVSVNCGAIPETLLEAELFGHEKGAFTGASEQRKGFFEYADKGTIFLDEIGEMPVETQVKLLRILESGEFSRLGSSEVKKVDVRVVAATNRNLERNVKNGTFRQDLFFRLRSVHILLPSLKEHPEDIPELIEYFIQQEDKSGISFEGIEPEALDMLFAHEWEGNIRELRNFVETLINLEGSAKIGKDEVAKYLRDTSVTRDNEFSSSSAIVKSENKDIPSMEMGIIFRTLLEIKNDVEDLKHMVNHNAQKIDQAIANQNELIMQTAEEVLDESEMMETIQDMSLEEIEEKLIRHSLKRFEGNRRLAADQLGISERTLYRKLKQYDIV